MTNKEIAKSFLKLAGKGDVDQAFNQRISTTTINILKEVPKH